MPPWTMSPGGTGFRSSIAASGLEPWQTNMNAKPPVPTAQAPTAVQPQVMPVRQPVATPGITPPSAQTLGGMPPINATSMISPEQRGAFRQALMDWRGQRPQFAQGGDPMAFRQQIQDWRGQRPQRPQFGGIGGLGLPNAPRPFAPINPNG